MSVDCRLSKLKGLRYILFRHCSYLRIEITSHHLLNNHCLWHEFKIITFRFYKLNPKYTWGLYKNAISLFLHLQLKEAVQGIYWSIYVFSKIFNWTTGIVFWSRFRCLALCFLRLISVNIPLLSFAFHFSSAFETERRFCILQQHLKLCQHQ